MANIFIERVPSEHKLLILAGAGVHRKVVEAAKSMGIYTIVADYLPAEKSPAKLIADEHWEISITDIDALVEKSKKRGVTAVLSFCIDPAQIPYFEVASRLGLPCYGTDYLFKTFTTKCLFKQFCVEHDVDVVPEYSIDDIYNGANIIYPILLKPSISRGSRGITVCKNKQEAIQALRTVSEASSDGKVIIERYMAGADDMALSYVVIAGEPYLLKIGDRLLGRKEDNLDRQQIFAMFPSKHTDEYVELVDPIVKAMIRKMNMPFGAVFLQGFYENGKVYMYDPGLRFPGSDYDLAVKVATGYDNMQTFVKYAITGDSKSKVGQPKDVYKLNGKKAMIFAVSCRPGKISRFKGLEEIASNPNVISTDLRVHPGETVPNSGDVKQRVLEFVAIFDSEDERKEFISKTYATLSILDENDKDMIVSKLEY